MEFKDVLRARRSCRAFAPDPLDEAQVLELIHACQWAPSPLNQQPWQFLVISDPPVKAQVRALGEEAARAVAAQGGPGWAAKYRFDFLDQAPLLLAVIYDPAQGGLGSYFNQPQGALMAVSAGIENLMLAAAEMGLGSLWFTFFDPTVMAQALGVPPDLALAGIIPLGRPLQESPAPLRRPPVIHRQRFGQAG